MIRRFLILQNYEIQNETATIFEKKSQTRICLHSVGITEQLGDRKNKDNYNEKRVRHKYASPQTSDTTIQLLKKTLRTHTLRNRQFVYVNRNIFMRSIFHGFSVIHFSC